MRIDWGYRALALGLIGIAVAAATARHAGLGWELGECLGLLALAGCVLLAAVPVRRRHATPPDPLTLRHHEVIGWTVVALACAHVVAALASDRTVVEYLKPTLPAYQFAGILATLGFVWLSASAGARARRRLFTDHRAFQAWHVAGSCVAVLLAAAHVLATDRYAHGWPRITAFAVLLSTAIALPLRPRPAADRGARNRGYVESLAFGRNSARILAAIAVSACLALLLATPAVSGAWRRPLARRTEALPLHFAHERHTQVNCIDCHHNYTDRTGFDTCIACHRSSRPDLKLAAEPRMHDFCYRCHREQSFEGRHGPAAGCTECHPRARSPGAMARHLDAPAATSPR